MPANYIMRCEGVLDSHAIRATLLQLQKPLHNLMPSNGLQVFQRDVQPVHGWDINDAIRTRPKASMQNADSIVNHGCYAPLSVEFLHLNTITDRVYERNTLPKPVEKKENEVYESHGLETCRPTEWVFAQIVVYRLIQRHVSEGVWTASASTHYTNTLQELSSLHPLSRPHSTKANKNVENPIVNASVLSGTELSRSNKCGIAYAHTECTHTHIRQVQVTTQAQLHAYTRLQAPVSMIVGNPF
jgi:hypothetical protein